jgi:hypothetical protein
MATPMNYVDPPDIPEGMTCREYMRLHHPARPRRRSLLSRLRRVSRGRR